MAGLCDKSISALDDDDDENDENYEPEYKPLKTEYDGEFKVPRPRGRPPGSKNKKYNRRGYDPYFDSYDVDYSAPSPRFESLDYRSYDYDYKPGRGGYGSGRGRGRGRGRKILPPDKSLRICADCGEESTDHEENLIHWRDVHPDKEVNSQELIHFILRFADKCFNSDHVQMHVRGRLRIHHGLCRGPQEAQAHT